MEYLKENILPVLLTGFGSALLLLVRFAVTKGLELLKAYTEQNKDRGVFWQVADQAEHFVALAVNDVLFSTEPSIKAKLADGKLTPEEFKEIGDEILAKVKTFLGEHGLISLAEGLKLLTPALEPYLMSLIKTAFTKKGVQVNPQ